ncbi:MAG: thioredoxin domain-containing protein [Sandaracinaceae bacterium]|nr:thioredoxin domain-containing protein [Sandaracinaceae bacterium]
MDQRTMAAQRWADHESALRSKYHGAGLYVRKQVYQRPDGVTMVTGGWAFLDGSPAIVPTDLDLLVVSDAAGPDGALDAMGREPAAVMRILGPYATEETHPIAHWAVRVPEDARPVLMAQIRALPEHTPGAAPVGGVPPMPSAFGVPPSGPAFRAAPPPAPAPPSSGGGGGSVVLILGIVGGAVLLGTLAICGLGGAMYALASRASEDPYVYEPYEYDDPYEPYADDVAPAADDPGDSLDDIAREPAGDRYVVPIPARVPSRGPAGAPITIQIFSDFQCPFCARVRPTIDQIVETYPSDVRVVWRHYPLPFHRDAMPAAEASVEVYEQAGDAAFWAYHDLLFDNQRALDAANLVALARRVPGVDAARVEAAVRDRRHRARVESDMDAVRDAGMRIGTPSFLIDGELVSGAQPFSRFRTAIEAARAR